MVKSKDDDADIEAAKNVVFAGANGFKKELDEIFGFSDDDKDNATPSDDENVQEGRAGVGASSLSKKNEDKSKIAQIAAKSKGRKRKAKTSAFDGIAPELRSWGSKTAQDEGGDSDEEATSKFSALKKRKNRQEAPLASVVVENSTEQPAKKKKKKKKKKEATEEPTEHEAVNEPQVQPPQTNGDDAPAHRGEGMHKEETLADKEKSTTPSKFPTGNSRPFTENAADGEPPFKRKRYKKTKKRSKQKNIRKDNRPEGSWRKNLPK